MSELGLNMKLNIAGFETGSIVDGPGLRFALFVQGCPHHCEGCHNPETWEFGVGKDVSVREIADKIAADPLIDGVTYSGGEPFEQAAALCELSDIIRAERSDLNIMCYSGYTYERLTELANAENRFGDLLARIDYLVDGPFILAQKSYELKFKGSRNQRFLDVKRSLAEGKAVLHEENNWEDLEIKLV